MKRKMIIGLGIFFLAFYSKAQENAPVPLSLEEAKKLALQNNIAVKNASLDVEIAKKKVWETTAMGLPQIEGTIGYQYNPDPPVMEMPDFSAFEQFLAGEISELPIAQNQLGEEHNVTFDATVSQLIFSGEYIVGLKASSTYKEISELSYEKSTKDIKEKASTAYFSVLVAKENLSIVDSSMAQIEQIYYELSEMQKLGFVDDVEVSQMKLNLQNLKNTKLELVRQQNLAFDYLKLVLNVDSSTVFKTTDNLDNLAEQTVDFANFSLENLTEYKLLENQVKSSKLLKQKEVTTYLPTVSAFYRHKEYWNEPDLNFEPKDVIGVNVSIPIFSSGMRHAKVRQAHFELEKSRNTKEETSRMLELSYSQALSSYSSSYSKYQLEKENRALSKLIFQNTLEKKKLGMASSMEVAQSQNQMLQAQQNYSMSVFELLNAKVELQKALGSL